MRSNSVVVFFSILPFSIKFKWELPVCVINSTSNDRKNFSLLILLTQNNHKNPAIDCMEKNRSLYAIWPIVCVCVYIWNFYDIATIMNFIIATNKMNWITFPVIAIFIPVFVRCGMENLFLLFSFMPQKPAPVE